MKLCGDAYMHVVLMLLDDDMDKLTVTVTSPASRHLSVQQWSDLDLTVNHTVLIQVLHNTALPPDHRISVQQQNRSPLRSNWSRVDVIQPQCGLL